MITAYLEDRELVEKAREEIAKLTELLRAASPVKIESEVGTFTPPSELPLLELVLYLALLRSLVSVVPFMYRCPEGSIIILCPHAASLGLKRECREGGISIYLKPDKRSLYQSTMLFASVYFEPSKELRKKLTEFTRALVRKHFGIESKVKPDVSLVIYELESLSDLRPNIEKYNISFTFPSRDKTYVEVGDFLLRHVGPLIKKVLWRLIEKRAGELLELSKLIYEHYKSILPELAKRYELI